MYSSPKPSQWQHASTIPLAILPNHRNGLSPQQSHSHILITHQPSQWSHSPTIPTASFSSHRNGIMHQPPHWIYFISQPSTIALKSSPNHRNDLIFVPNYFFVLKTTVFTQSLTNHRLDSHHESTIALASWINHRLSNSCRASTTVLTIIHQPIPLTSWSMKSIAVST